MPTVVQNRCLFYTLICDHIRSRSWTSNDTSSSLGSNIEVLGSVVLPSLSHSKRFARSRRRYLAMQTGCAILFPRDDDDSGDEPRRLWWQRHLCGDVDVQPDYCVYISIIPRTQSGVSSRKPVVPRRTYGQGVSGDDDGT